jgi:hypothetical protein
MRHSTRSADRRKLRATSRRRWLARAAAKPLEDEEAERDPGGADSGLRLAEQQSGFSASTWTRWSRRPAAGFPLSVKDIHSYYPMGDSVLPYVVYAIEEELGIRIDCTVDAIAISGE